MTQIKKREVEIILRIPDDDIAYTLNSSDKSVVADGKEMEQVANQIFNKYGGAFEKLAK